MFKIVGGQRVPLTPDDEADLARSAPAPGRPLISKAALVEKLDQLGKLAQAELLLQNVTPIVRQRWYAKPVIYADDPDLLASLRKLGVDPRDILGEEFT
jgi:hypothetical protein